MIRCLIAVVPSKVGRFWCLKGSAVYYQIFYQVNIPFAAKPFSCLPQHFAVAVFLRHGADETGFGFAWNSAISLKV